MSVVDFLLNVCGLLFWLKIRAARADASGQSRRGVFLAGIALLTLLLLVRGLLYWRLGSGVGWVASLDLGIVGLPFNSASKARMLAYSVASFGVLLVVYHLWLLLLSVVNAHASDAEPWQKQTRRQLGWVGRLPAPFKVCAPWLCMAGLWYAANPLLARWGMTPAAESSVRLWQQGMILGFGSALSWGYLVLAVLLLYQFSSVFFVGASGFWRFVQVTGRNLVSPLDGLPLRLGRLNLRPLAGALLIAALMIGGRHGLRKLFIVLSP